LLFVGIRGLCRSRDRRERQDYWYCVLLPCLFAAGLLISWAVSQP
jgi:hypothetical protein